MQKNQVDSALIAVYEAQFANADVSKLLNMWSVQRGDDMEYTAVFTDVGNTVGVSTVTYNKEFDEWAHIAKLKIDRTKMISLGKPMIALAKVKDILRVSSVLSVQKYIEAHLKELKAPKIEGDKVVALHVDDVLHWLLNRSNKRAGRSTKLNAFVVHLPKGLEGLSIAEIMQRVAVFVADDAELKIAKVMSMKEFKRMQNELRKPRDNKVEVMTSTPVAGATGVNVKPSAINNVKPIVTTK